MRTTIISVGNGGYNLALKPTLIVRDIVPTLIKGTDDNVKEEVALQIIAIKSRE